MIYIYGIWEGIFAAHMEPDKIATSYENLTGTQMLYMRDSMKVLARQLQMDGPHDVF